MPKSRFSDLSFELHDFNNNGTVDTNDIYDLMYINKQIKTKSDYLLQRDAITLNKAISSKSRNQSPILAS